MIPDIESLTSKLKPEMFAYTSRLENRDIPVVQAGPENVGKRARDIAEPKRSWVNELSNVEIAVQPVLCSTLQFRRFPGAIGPLAAALRLRCIYIARDRQRVTGLQCTDPVQLP